MTKKFLKQIFIKKESIADLFKSQHVKICLVKFKIIL